MTETEEKNLRRHYFNQVAGLYDQIRPQYPEELFDAIVDLANLGVDTPVIEIGAGTGIATLPLAQRGLSVLAVEPGAEMLAVARDKLADFSNVSFFHGLFEDLPTPNPRVQAITSGQAFHWIDPERRCALLHQALRPGGWLMPFWHFQTLDSPLFLLSRPIYGRIYGVPDIPSVEERAARYRKEIEDSGLFQTPSAHTFANSRLLTAAQHDALLRTYSENRVEDADMLRQLRDGIGELIEAQGGQIEMRMQALLIAAQT